jgi:hypothetical protein
VVFLMPINFFSYSPDYDAEFLWLAPAAADPFAWTHSPETKAKLLVLFRVRQRERDPDRTDHTRPLDLQSQHPQHT